jgi:hypothetical protein
MVRTARQLCADRIGSGDVKVWTNWSPRATARLLCRLTLSSDVREPLMACARNPHASAGNVVPQMSDAAQPVKSNRRAGSYGCKPSLPFLLYPVFAGQHTYRPLQRQPQMPTSQKSAGAWITTAFFRLRAHPTFVCGEPRSRAHKAAHCTVGLRPEPSSLPRLTLIDLSGAGERR